MNLLLTSGGLTNEKLVTAFEGLVEKPLSEVSVELESFERTPEKIGAVAAQTETPLYALDDNSALLVRGNTIQVISSGEHKVYNA